MNEPARATAWRLLGEFSVVCLGVLLALAAEGWWQGSQEAARAEKYLRGVYADLLEAEESLDAAIMGTQRQADLTDEVLAWLESDQTLPDTLRVRGVNSGGVPVVPMGALDALIATGDVNLLENEELRLLLVSEHAALNRGIRFMEQLLDRGFVISTDLARANAAVRVERGVPPGRIQAEALRRNPEVIGIYEAHALWLRNRLGVMRNMLRTSVEVLKGGVADELENIE